MHFVLGPVWSIATKLGCRRDVRFSPFSDQIAEPDVRFVPTGDIALATSCDPMTTLK